MQRIIIHWTAGTNNANSTDKEHYHFLIEGDGSRVKGTFPVTANEVCRTDSKGKALYSAHTGGGNTGSIGVSMCGMYVPSGIPVKQTKYPLTKVQVEAMFKLVAELSKKYKIPITPDTVMTHYEFGKKHPKTSSAGKIDIVYLPPYPTVKKDEVGDFIRNKIRWYFNKL